MNYLAKMTIYDFNKKKAKFDYSIIPVKLDNGYIKKNVRRFKSETSKDYYVDFKDSSNVIIKKRDDSNNKISRILRLFSFPDGTSLEDAEIKINNEMYRLFNKKFWFKLKHKKLLKRKIALGQFKI